MLVPGKNQQDTETTNKIVRIPNLIRSISTFVDSIQFSTLYSSLKFSFNSFRVDVRQQLMQAKWTADAFKTCPLSLLPYHNHSRLHVLHIIRAARWQLHFHFYRGKNKQINVHKCRISLVSIHLHSAGMTVLGIEDTNFFWNHCTMVTSENGVQTAGWQNCPTQNGLQRNQQHIIHRLSMNLVSKIAEYGNNFVKNNAITTLFGRSYHCHTSCMHTYIHKRSHSHTHSTPTWGYFR